MLLRAMTAEQNRRNRAQLQLAVDVLSLDEALEAAAQTYPHFDIIEVGTPLIIEEGLAPVERLKALYPDKVILADLKIMDAGHIEAGSGFARGADIVTILALADDATVAAAVSEARRHGGRIMADLINTPHPGRRAAQLEALGVDIMCVHTAYDTQSTKAEPMAELIEVRAAVQCPVAIAGGMKRATVAAAVEAGADIVVVGGAILKASSPGDEAAAIIQQLRGSN